MASSNYKHASGVKFNAKHVASLTQADWLKEATGQYELGTSTKDEEAKELKAIQEECKKLIKAQETEAKQ